MTDWLDWSVELPESLSLDYVTSTHVVAYDTEDEKQVEIQKSSLLAGDV